MLFFRVLILVSLFCVYCSAVGDLTEIKHGPKEYVKLSAASKIHRMPNGDEMFKFATNFHAYRIELNRIEHSIYNYNGTIYTYNSHFSKRNFLGIGTTESGFYVGMMQLEASKSENPENWFFVQLPDYGNFPIFFTLSDFNGLETGTLIICAKIKFNGHDAVLVVADGMVISPADSGEKKTPKEEFRKQTLRLQKNDLVKYIRNHATVYEDSDKVLKFESISQGIVGVGGDRSVYDDFDSKLFRDNIIPLIDADENQQAADLYAKINDYMQKVPTKNKGTIILAQIINGERKLCQWDYDPVWGLFFVPRLGRGITVNEIMEQGNNEKFKIFGLGSWDEQIKIWLVEIFGGPSHLVEQKFTREKLLRQLNRFASKVQTKYAGVIGYVLVSTPEESIIRIDTNMSEN